MSYSYDKYIKPLASTDTNLHIVDNDNIIKYTLNPFSILNVLVNNNTIRISVKSGRVIIIPFSTINESKLALPNIKTSIDSLTSKSPLFIGNDIKNYINNNQSSPFYYQDNIPVGTGTNAIKEGTLWYDSEYGYLYIYVFDGTYYQWVTAAGSVGDTGPIGATGSSGINGTSGITGTSGSSGTSGIDGTSGSSGIDGTSGSSGIDGTSGTSGSSGTSGINGTSGTSGSSGTSGINGTSGIDGTSGSSGIDGTSGSSGINGTSGIDGTSGSSGIDGTSGSSGIDGTSGTSGSGTSGIDGTSGSSGIDGTSGTSGSGTSGINGTSGSSGSSIPTTSLSLSESLTVSGTSSLNGLTVLQEVIEVINTTPGATSSTVVYNFSTGTNWYHSSANTNYTANFTNVPTDSNRVITVTIVIVQGSTPYVPTAVQINSSATTIKWSGSNTGNAIQTDIIGFTFMRISSNWVVLGQINTFA